MDFFFFEVVERCALGIKLSLSFIGFIGPSASWRKNLFSWMKLIMPASCFNRSGFLSPRLVNFRVNFGLLQLYLNEKLVCIGSFPHRTFAFSSNVFHVSVIPWLPVHPMTVTHLISTSGRAIPTSTMAKAKETLYAESYLQEQYSGRHTNRTGTIILAQRMIHNSDVSRNIASKENFAGKFIGTWISEKQS